MKLASIVVNGKQKVGLLYEEEMYDLNELELQLYKEQTLPLNLIGIIAGEHFQKRVEEILTRLKSCWDCRMHALKADEYTYLAPIPRPKKNVICVGKNYREHAIEMGGVEEIPEHIMFFTKAPTSVIGHNQVIDPHWHVTSELDYEGELGVVIGKTMKNVLEEDALSYVFGYTIVNDISARDVQYRHKQFFLGKSLDTYCPIGPVVVTKDEIKHPNQLSLVTKVNEEIRQNGYTSEMIFPVATILSTLSKGMTLEPGDIIATGTPAGVGKGFNPPRLLKSGDVIEITVEGIGTLRNVVGE